MKAYLRNFSAANRIFVLILALSLSVSSFLFWSVNTCAGPNPAGDIQVSSDDTIQTGPVGR